MNQREQWQVAGSAAEVYEQELVPAIFGPWAPIVIDLAQPQKGDRVLDVACGTGIVARMAAQRVGPTGTVVGVDLNPGMLKVARTVCSTGSHSGAPIQWEEASADKLPFSNESFDVAFCQLGLQFFPDRAAALREMRRVLVTGGRVALMVWCDISESPGFSALAKALEASRRSGRGEYHASPILFGQRRRIDFPGSRRGLPRPGSPTAGWLSSLCVGREACDQLYKWLAIGGADVADGRCRPRGPDRRCEECLGGVFGQ